MHSGLHASTSLSRDCCCLVFMHAYPVCQCERQCYILSTEQAWTDIEQGRQVRRIDIRYVVCRGQWSIINTEQPWTESGKQVRRIDTHFVVRGLLDEIASFTFDKVTRVSKVKFYARPPACTVMTRFGARPGVTKPISSDRVIFPSFLESPNIVYQMIIEFILGRCRHSLATGHLLNMNVIANIY